MTTCDECRRDIAGPEHSFSGYGYRIKFCAEHCPGFEDGSYCHAEGCMAALRQRILHWLHEHPDEWKAVEIARGAGLDDAYTAGRIAPALNALLEAGQVTCQWGNMWRAA